MHKFCVRMISVTNSDVKKFDFQWRQIQKTYSSALPQRFYFPHWSVEAYYFRARSGKEQKVTRGELISPSFSSFSYYVAVPPNRRWIKTKKYANFHSWRVFVCCTLSSLNCNLSSPSIKSAWKEDEHLAEYCCATDAGSIGYTNILINLLILWGKLGQKMAVCSIGG